MKPEDSKPGTKYDLVANLKKELLELKSPPRNKDVVKLVASYWQHPDNKRAREQAITVGEARRSFLDEWAIHWCSPGASDFEIIWPSLLKESETDPQSLEALKQIVIAWLDEDQMPLPVRDAAARLIRGEFRPNAKTAPKIPPSDHHKKLQLALAVWAVWQLDEYSLETGGSKVQNAFSAVSTATQLSYETVREAWKKHRRRLPRGAKAG